jgi:hypothetical protein
LIDGLAVPLEMVWMISIRLKYLPDVFAFESSVELVGVKEVVPELRRWCSELVPQVPSARAAQVGVVVSREQ